MGCKLDRIVPWGRSFDEYVAMFCLTEADMGRRILGCGDGPASFNAEMAKMGRSVVSVDPLYALSAGDLQPRIAAARESILEQLAMNQASYIWTTIHSPAHLVQVRMEAMRRFLEDYEQGRMEERYLPYELPHLPFPGHCFHLCLCSHLLFTYSDHLSADFLEQAVLEMCRVAREVRVFPVVDTSGQPSPHLESVCERLKQCGHVWSVEAVPYEFQRGAREMLRIITRSASPSSPANRPAGP